MNAADMHARFELVFGGCCPVPEARGDALVKVDASTAVFSKLLRHWQELPEHSRPHLRGLARSRGSDLQLILDAGGRSPFVLLSVDWGGKRALPTLTGIWPYASWWEDELCSFEKVEIEGRSKEGGIAWRRN